MDSDDGDCSGNQHLRIIKIYVRAGPGDRMFPTVALIDSGCNRTLIDESLARRMGLRVLSSEAKLQGVHGSRQELMAEVKFEVSRDSVSFFEVPRASTKRNLEMDAAMVRWRDWAATHPPFDRIAMELDNVAYSDIKVFLGLDVEDLTLPLDRRPSHWIESSDGMFRAWLSKLGWTITGPSGFSFYASNPSYAEVPGDHEEEIVESPLISEFRAFNDLEGIGILSRPDIYSLMERRELSRMESLSRKLPEGRWEVPMLTMNFTRLPPSEVQARNRLLSLHRRLERDERLKKLYHAGIRKDVELGYIRKLSHTEAEKLRKGIHWFLPHFPVFHPDKPDKCRRVLDAAAKNGGVSLNSFLEKGPNCLESLLGVLLRFRRGRVAVNADVNAMFSQVAIPEHQQPLTAFLWNESPDRRPEVYVNWRHIFGAACSPAVAIFALEKAAEGDPVLQKIVKSSFYMDDFYWSGNSEEEVSRMAGAIERILKTGGFDLSKWMSNSAKVARKWPMEERAKELKPMGSDLEGQLPVVKALGVAWDCATDTFAFESRKLQKPVTNVASVLSILASVFDPLGIVAPYVLTGKQLFQEFWKGLQHWYDPVPESYKKKWLAWMEGLPTIAKLGVRRWFGFSPNVETELHVFSDASTKGYGAVAYLKAKGHKPVFLQARTRVVPDVRKGNVPRLELQAVLVAVRMARTLLQELTDMNIKNTVF